ncbi:MAG TPA: hypothetical protein VGR15_00960 [Bacteroidota bacterium]|nr:hypothetical protein [Bacteroidota bacterium]
MADTSAVNWKKYMGEIVVGIALMLIGGYFGKFVFKDKPELTYQIIEGDANSKTER